MISKNKIKSLLKNKDAKALAENFASLSLLRIAGYIFPLITIPYLARVIGVDGFGKIAFAAAIIVWFQTITDWGFSYTATRDVARCRNDKDRVSEIFSNVLWAQFFLMVVSLIILIIIVFCVPRLYEMKGLVFMTFLLIPGHLFFPEWLFQGLERMKYITVLNVLAKLFFTLAVFVFIKEKSDYILQPLLTSFGFLLSGGIAMYVIIYRWKIKIFKSSFKEVFRTIKTSADVFLNNLFPNLYNAFSTILLGFFGGPVANGLLDAGSKLIGVALHLLTIISRTFFPFLSRKIGRHDIYAKYNIFLSSALSVTFFCFAPFLISIFFTKEFVDAVTVMRILSISIIFYSMASVYGTNYLIINGHEKVLRNITFYCSLIGLCLSLPLIYFYSYIGAAIVIACSRFFLGTLSYLTARKFRDGMV